MNVRSDLAMAYHMGYEDALARNLPKPSKAGVLEQPKARRIRVTVDERRCIGHDECSECGATVGMADRFCRMCGKEFS